MSGRRTLPPSIRRRKRRRKRPAGRNRSAAGNVQCSVSRGPAQLRLPTDLHQYRRSDRIARDDAREPDHPGGIDLLLTWFGIVGPRKARSKFGDRINGATDYFPHQLRSYLPAGANFFSCWINKQDFRHSVSGGTNRICTGPSAADCKLPQAARGGVRAPRQVLRV